MPREEPFFRKCCYYIPLKSCLHVWSCIKTIVDLSLAAFLTLLVILLAGYDELTSKRFTLAHMLIITIVLLVIDSAFMLVLTIGLCTNNLRTLRAFFYYCIYMVFIGGSCLIGVLVMMDIVGTPDGPVFIASFVVAGLINVALDVCMIFTLKSEMIKLRNKQQYEFVQMPTLDKTEEGHTDPTEPFQTDVNNLDA